MKLKIIRKFDAAHKLPNYDGKCRNMHGHSYKVSFIIEGKISESGMVEDFAKLKKFLDNNLPDHSCLNDILENPTSEHIANYLMEKISAVLKKEMNLELKELELWESDSTAVIVNRNIKYD